MLFEMFEMFEMNALNLQFYWKFEIIAEPLNVTSNFIRIVSFWQLFREYLFISI